MDGNAESVRLNNEYWMKKELLIKANKSDKNIWEKQKIFASPFFKRESDLL